MQNPVLNLLLNFNGRMSRKSYCAAVVLLLVVIGLSASREYFRIFSTTYIFANFPRSHTYMSFSALIWAFTPILIPVYFLAFYSAIIVTIKRSRALNLPIAVIVLFVAINSLFYNFILKSKTILEYIYASSSDAEMNIIPPVFLLSFVLAIAVLGLVVNLYFMLNSKGSDDHSVTNDLLGNGESKEKGYGQFSYIFFVGKLMLANVAIMLFLAILAFLFSDFLNDMLRGRDFYKTVLWFSVFYCGIFLGLYMHATAKRLNDAGYKTYLLVLYFMFVVGLSGLFAYFIALQASFSLILLAISNFLIVLFGGVQVIPFLLKSKVVD